MHMKQNVLHGKSPNIIFVFTFNESSVYLDDAVMAATLKRCAKPFSLIFMLSKPSNIIYILYQRLLLDRLNDRGIENYFFCKITNVIPARNKNDL